MASQGVSHIRGTVNRVASENIAVNLLVEPHTTADQVSLAPASGCPIAVAYEAVASGARGDFQLIVPGDIVKSKGSTTIAAGDYLKAAASGEIAPEASVAVRTAATIGVAEEACAGAAVAFLWRAI